MPFLPLALLLVLVIRALRPLVTIRFGQLPSMFIGSFARCPEVYLCERDAGLYGRRAVDVWYHENPISNLQLKKMWGRSLHTSDLVRIPARLNQWLPGGQNHVIPLWINKRSTGRDIEGLLAITDPHLQFTDEEEQLGGAYLRQMGVPIDGEFVCFHARDPVYRNTKLPGRDDTHNAYRNVSIIDYLPAAEEAARRGYFAFRMGSMVQEALPSTDSNVIDYASNGRTDFLDIYLAAKCRFFLGCGSGIDAISTIFRRPTIYANYVPLHHISTWGPDDLTIPKKLWLREEGRFLTFREILQSEIGGFARTEQYDRLGIELVENTPEEITAVVVELDERLNGSWQPMEEDEELQRRFWSLVEPSELSKVFRSRVGADFLRRNRELLD